MSLLAAACCEKRGAFGCTAASLRAGGHFWSECAVTLQRSCERYGCSSCLNEQARRGPRFSTAILGFRSEWHMAGARDVASREGMISVCASWRWWLSERSSERSSGEPGSGSVPWWRPSVSSSILPVAGEQRRQSVGGGVKSSEAGWVEWFCVVENGSPLDVY